MGPPWVLFPAGRGDHIELKSGNIVVTKSLKVEIHAPIKLFSTKDTGTFVRPLEAKDRKWRLAEFQFVTCVQANSPYLRLNSQVNLTAEGGKLGGDETASDELGPFDAVILGKAALPENTWARLKQGLEAKGGSVEFRRDGIFLSPGTTLAKAPLK